MTDDGGPVVVGAADVIPPEDIPQEKAVRRAEDIANEERAIFRAARVRSILWQPRDRWAAWWTRQAINGDGGKYPGERKPPMTRERSVALQLEAEFHAARARSLSFQEQLIRANDLIVRGLRGRL